MNNDDFQYGVIVKHQSGAQGVLVAKAVGNMLGISLDNQEGLHNLRFEFAEECEIVMTAKEAGEAFLRILLKGERVTM
ncbi:hypothetical protein [Pseudomonas hormoni]